MLIQRAVFEGFFFFFSSLQRNRMSKQRVMPFFPLAGRSSELRSLPNCQPTYGTCPVTQELKFRMATNCSDGFTGNDFFRRKILFGEGRGAVAWHFQWSCDSKTSLALEGALQRTLLLENSNWQLDKWYLSLWYPADLISTLISLVTLANSDPTAPSDLCGPESSNSVWGQVLILPSGWSVG